ncbi:hypothetical protein SKAU_G00143260 [Synaphobranchus kaupii]|uniref:Uncharacterized protein n=1 Tax=Synaphobranchus kaupii TaxID=118154 RepID=A0A9Q1J4L7_SYNKA|nr:hypothetical protein SKAU_G00143260 [Synaphobranchus kaupii]
MAELKKWPPLCELQWLWSRSLLKGPRYRLSACVPPSPLRGKDRLAAEAPGKIEFECHSEAYAEISP